MTFYRSRCTYSTVVTTSFFFLTALGNELKNYGEKRDGDLWNKKLLLEFLRQLSPVYGGKSLMECMGGVHIYISALSRRGTDIGPSVCFHIIDIDTAWRCGWLPVTHCDHLFHSSWKWMRELSVLTEEAKQLSNSPFLLPSLLPSPFPPSLPPLYFLAFFYSSFSKMC